MTVERFGEAPGGDPVERATISGGGLTAKVISWGAALQDLRLDGHAAPLVLGFETFAPYPEHSPYFGAIAGRFANRIGQARFEIDGRAYKTDPNFLGAHTLHGGAAGVGKRVWTIAEARDDAVTLIYRARDGEMGFPGNLDIACVYRVAPDGRLIVELSAETDAPTLCSLAHHSYFNLEDGGRTAALDHQLRIDAGAYLPVDDQLIPTGIVQPVDGSDFDFRTARAIRDRDGRPGYDHNFCLAAARGALRPAVEARAARSGVVMEVWTTEPGVQFYDGARVGRDLPGSTEFSTAPMPDSV